MTTGPDGGDAALAAELLAMAEEDGRVRAELAAAGTLFGGYHPRMAEVHRRNARRLAAVLDAGGWPGAPASAPRPPTPPGSCYSTASATRR